MVTTQLDLFEPVVGRITQPTTLPDMAGLPPAVNVDTSLAAADRIKKLPKTKFSEAALLKWLTERAGFGATDDESREYFGWDGDYERPRRWSLVKQGLNQKTALRRMTKDGNPAIVWKVV